MERKDSSVCFHINSAVCARARGWLVDEDYHSPESLTGSKHTFSLKRAVKDESGSDNSCPRSIYNLLLPWTSDRKETAHVRYPRTEVVRTVSNLRVTKDKQHLSNLLSRLTMMRQETDISIPSTTVIRSVDNNIDD